MNVFSILFRNAVKTVAVCAMVLSVAACGVKSSPAQPSGSVYPRQYPATSSKSEIGAPPAQAGQSREDKDLGAQERSGAPLSPLGFPLEYPNRPSYK